MDFGQSGMDGRSPSASSLYSSGSSPRHIQPCLLAPIYIFSIINIDVNLHFMGGLFRYFLLLFVGFFELGSDIEGNGEGSCLVDVHDLL